MPRCGCSGQCSCVINAKPGITVEGRGDQNNPYYLGIDGDQIAADGLGWNASTGTLSVRVGDGLGFDPSGAVYNTSQGGESGGGGGTAGATVSALARRENDVIGGSCGAGLYIKPGGTRNAYSYGVQQGLDFMHVPVRFLRDGQPVVFVQETTQGTNVNPPERVQDQDGHRWSVLASTPGVWPIKIMKDNEEDPDPGWVDDDPQKGWFGYMEPNQYGLTFLGDVLSQVGGRVVLVLELRFPYRVEGQPLPDTPPERTDSFLRQVQQLLRTYGIQSSVIVSSSEYQIPGQGGTSVNVLDYFANEAAVAPHFEDPDNDPPKFPTVDKWPAKWKWVLASKDMPRKTLQSYVDSGRNTLLLGVSRQYLRESLVNKPNGIGAKGVVSGDPVYYGGGTPSTHPLSGYRYRHPADSWNFNTVEHGVLPPGPETIDNADIDQRGTLTVGKRRLYLGPKQGPPTTGAECRWVTNGWMCPLPNTTNYTLDFWIGYDHNWGDKEGYLAIAFGLPTDHEFIDAKVGGTPGGTLDTGYVFYYHQNGKCCLFVTDQGTVTELSPTSAPGVTCESISEPPVGGGPERSWCRAQFRLNVGPGGIQAIHVAGAAETELFTVKSPAATAHRGGYIQLGRHAGPKPGWTGYFGQFAYTPH